MPQVEEQRQHLAYLPMADKAAAATAAITAKVVMEVLAAALEDIKKELQERQMEVAHLVRVKVKQQKPLKGLIRMIYTVAAAVALVTGNKDLDMQVL